MYNVFEGIKESTRAVIAEYDSKIADLNKQIELQRRIIENQQGMIELLSAEKSRLYDLLDSRNSG